MKKYLIKVLYDNGREEMYKFGELTEEELDEMVTGVMNTLSEGSKGSLYFPNDDGLLIIVDLSKVSKVEFLKG